MNRVVVRPEHFETAVLKALSKYGDEVLQTSEEATHSVARQTVSALKGSAPAGGRYAKGWSHKARKGGAYKLSETVYNRTDYMLTHLLEKPHVTGGGTHPVGKYPTHVDYTGTIAKVETEYTTKYMEEVLSKL